VCYPCQYNVESPMTQILCHRGVQILSVIGHFIKNQYFFFVLRAAKSFISDCLEEQPLSPSKLWIFNSNTPE
jgi:hypothetical protein